MKRMVLAALALVLLLSAGCGAAQETAAPAVRLSEEFARPTAAPAPEPMPTPEPVIPYALGSGVTLWLPEGFSVNVMEDGSFFLTGSTVIISGAWYDADHFEYLGYAFPETAGEAAAALIPAEYERLSEAGDGDAFTVEYAYEGETARWAATAVLTRRGDLWWKVEFLCPDSVYDAQRADFAAWAETMELPGSMADAGAYEMTSETGLFTLTLPRSCVVITDDTAAEDLGRYGLTAEEAGAFLTQARERAAGADLICRTDFGAMLVVTADPEAGFTQAEMPELEDSLAVDPALAGEDYAYEGMVRVEENPNLFYLVRIHRGGVDELGFTTAHDATGTALTFSFVGFSDDEARDILKTLSLTDSENE